MGSICRLLQLKHVRSNPTMSVFLPTLVNKKSKLDENRARAVTRETLNPTREITNPRRSVPDWEQRCPSLSPRICDNKQNVHTHTHTAHTLLLQ